MVSIIYVSYCHKIWGSYVNKISSYSIFRQFFKIFGAHVACLSVLITKFCHSLNWEEWVLPINIFLCNTLRNTKICQNKSKVCIFNFFLLCWSTANFIWKISISNFKSGLIYLGVVSWCPVNYATEGNPTKIPNKCLQKCFEFFSFFFFC